MSKMKKILVDGNTRLKDLRIGDLVMTAEIYRVDNVKNSDLIEVSEDKPQCEVCGPGRCAHQCIKTLGWGQQSIAKILKIGR